MYTLVAFVLLAIALGILMDVVNLVLSTLKLDEMVAKLPIVGAQLTVGVSILMVWLLDVRLVEVYAGNLRESWIQIVVDGILIAGMIPVKDAVIAAIGKGLRA
ncbi:MAG: hypothetical protein ACI81L_001047 [Verrucomicrobiales bacterium]|jgi:hypothetical protein